MINQTLHITDLKFSNDGNALAVGYNTGKVELWRKSDSSWVLQWEVKYTCLPVLMLANFKNHVVVVERGWQLFYLEKETGWIVKSVILDFNVYKNCCPSSIAFASVHHDLLFVASETGPVHVLDLECLLEENSDPIVNLSGYNRYKFHDDFSGINFFSGNEPCASVIGRLSVPGSISGISVSDNQFIVRGISKNGQLLHWDLYTLELSTDIMYQPVDLSSYTVTGMAMLNSRYMITTGFYDNEAVALLMDINSGIILDRLDNINPFGLKKGIVASGESIILLADNKLLLLEIHENRFHMVSGIEWSGKAASLMQPVSAFDIVMYNNTVALTCKDDVMLVDMFSKNMDTLKNSICTMGLNVKTINVLIDSEAYEEMKK